MWTLITLYTQFCMNEIDLTFVIQDFKFPFFMSQTLLFLLYENSGNFTDNIDGFPGGSDGKESGYKA